MTKKFVKEWGVGPESDTDRARVQVELDGGARIVRDGCVVRVADIFRVTLGTPGKAVGFAAALNRLRRPLRLVKKDLDEDWARRVKERDGQTCVLCGVMGTKSKPGNGTKVDPLTAHHWLKTKARAGMARWARPCGVTVHFAEHIHTLHENPCWADLEPIARRVEAAEPPGMIPLTLAMSENPPDEECVRRLWRERVGSDLLAARGPSGKRSVVNDSDENGLAGAASVLAAATGARDEAAVGNTKGQPRREEERM